VDDDVLRGHGLEDALAVDALMGWDTPPDEDAAGQLGLPGEADPGAPAGSVAHTWTCAECGRWAMRVTATPSSHRSGDPAGVPLGVGVVAETGIGSIWTAASELAPDGSTVDVADLVRRGDADGLRRLDAELAPLWCRACAAVYCIDDWRHSSTYDPDGGFFEEERGTCPRGHEQRLWD
jgi:hypothetical protein